MGQRNEPKDYFELNENENTTCANLGDIAKVVLIEKCTGLNSYIRKKKRFQTNYLSFHLEKLKNRESETQSKHV